MATATLRMDEAPLPASTATDTAIQPIPQLFAYHCLCATHLLSTTHELSSLPRRAAPSLDRAYILPYARPPKKVRLSYPQPAHGSNQRDYGSTSEANDEEEDADTERLGLTVLHNSTTPSKSQDDAGTHAQEGGGDIILISKDNGFERRWLWRCARCKLVIGYWLGWPDQAAEDMEADTNGKNDRQEVRRPDVLFVLPEALVSTKAMKEGKMGEGTKIT